uniref:Uncharacterized protein n=1 Tax=Pseudomonas fluorescens (strain SBW25) TaxID=216595 RepID=A0A0G4E6I5_PSEFS|nr:hypothetical protein PQBR55_0183 [Pseudomonas fluorescens SBW25]
MTIIVIIGIIIGGIGKGAIKLTIKAALKNINNIELYLFKNGEEYAKL